MTECFNEFVPYLVTICGFILSQVRKIEDDIS